MKGANMELEVIADYRCEVGEGPLWHPFERCLYWLDIPHGRIFRYDPARQQHAQVWQGPPIGGFTVQADGALLLFGKGGSIARWHEGHLTTISAEIPGERDGRFNDVIADPVGRVFCGTMPVSPTADSPGHLGRLYLLHPDRTLTQVLDGITISNGMGFTPNGGGLYHTDSEKRRITLFDYDKTTGAISNPRVFVTIPEHEGVPDGLTVDAEGFVWSARWDGACLVRYSPAGTEVLRIPFPNARKVSSLTFGGEDYRDLYVTTAGGNDRVGNGAEAGVLYRLRPGIQGTPEFFSRIAC